LLLVFALFEPFCVTESGAGAGVELLDSQGFVWKDDTAVSAALNPFHNKSNNKSKKRITVVIRYQALEDNAKPVRSLNDSWDVVSVSAAVEHENSVQHHGLPIRVSHPNWISCSAQETSVRTDMKSPVPASHGIHCDSCGNDIVTVRFNCFFCSSFNICEACEIDGQHGHDPLHAFIKIPTPDQCPFSGVIAMKRKNCGIKVTAKLHKAADAIVVEPNSDTIFGWRILNESQVVWKNCHIQLVEDNCKRCSGVSMYPTTADPVSCRPNQAMDLFATVRSPSQPGSYTVVFRLIEGDGTPFGPYLEEVINVIPSNCSRQPGSATAGTEQHPDHDYLEYGLISPVVEHVCASDSNSNSKPEPGSDSDSDSDSDSEVGLDSSAESDIYSTALASLHGMGFKNRLTNLNLLKQGKTIEEVVEFFLQQT
jgi:Ig-like domain from next to BRCA1 gene/Zinc finger, ZZ type